MRYTVKIVSSYFVMAMLTAGLFANDGVKKERLPDHKKAKLEHAVQDIVPGAVQDIVPGAVQDIVPGAVQNIDPGFVETKPINDVIHSVVPREQRPQENTSKVRRITGPSTDIGNDFTKEDLKALLQRYETKNPPLNNEELMLVENFLLQSQEQKKNIISVNNYNRFNRYSRTHILSDDFSYSDGSLVGNGSWAHYSGNTTGEIQVSSGTVLINDSDYEDARVEFTSVTSGTVYFGMDVQLADPGSYSGTDFEYVFGFADSANTYSMYGRTSAAAFSATGWSPGLANNSSTEEATWASELSYATNYRLVVGTDISTGISDLWVDPTASSDTKISGTGSVTISKIGAVFLRQSGATPNLSYTLDNLVVSETFSDVITTTTTTTLSEGFEGTFPPMGWTNTTITGHAWTQSSSYTNSGSYSAKYTGSSGGPHTGELITPRLNLTTSHIDSLVYYLKNDDWSGDQNECAVYVSTNLGTTWTLITNHNTSITSFTRYAHALESYTQNDSVYIKFLGEDNWGYGVYLDDLSVPPKWVDPNPVATLSESSLDFGTVNTESTSSQTVVLTNSGGSALTGTVASDAAEFTVVAVGAVATTLTDTFTVVCSDVYADTWDGATMDVLVNGAVVLNDISATSGNYTETYKFEVTDDDAVTTDYTSGSWESEHSYAIYDNAGTEVASDGPSPGTGVSFTADVIDISLPSLTDVINVAAGASDTIIITYAPSAVSAQSGNIVFTHNATSSPDTVSVSGTGMAELLVEGFEGSWPPSSWTDATTTSYGWNEGPYGGAHSGSNWAYCNLAGSELVSPSLTVPSAGAYRLKFWYRNESSSYSQSMDVKVGSDILLQIVDNATHVYQEEVVSLAAYAGQTIQVTFVGQTGSGGGSYGICLDDVVVELIPPEPTLSLSIESAKLSPITIGSTSTSVAFNVGSNSGAGTLVVDSITTSNSAYSAALTNTSGSGGNPGIVFSGQFGNAVVNGNTYTNPTGAEAWAGFANEDISIYPFSFPNGGTITFTGATAGTDADVYFRHEYNPYPDTEPSFNTGSVTVSGTAEASYSVAIPAQDAANTYSSFLLYVTTSDAPVTLTNVTVRTTSDTVFAGGNLDLDLSWTPSSFGLTSADVIIYHNASTSPDTFSLSGEAGYHYVDFDDQSFPVGWRNVDLDTAETGYYETLYGAAWSFNNYNYPTAPGYGGYYARSHFDYAGSNDWMITSKLSVVSGDSVIFHSNVNGTILEDTLHVYVSTTDNELASFTTEIGEVVSQGYTNIRSAFDLSSYAGTDIYVAIVHHGSVGTNYYSYPRVDDVLLPAKWINPAVEAVLSTDTLDFGGAFANYVAKTETFTITNNGAPDLAITGFTSDNAAVTVSPATATLAYDSSATFTLTLTATTVSDTGSATLTIASNDTANPTLAVSWITAAYDLTEFSLSTGLNDTVATVYSGGYVYDEAHDTIHIQDDTGLMASMMVFVDLDHTYSYGIDLTLTAPNGDSVVFFDGLGGYDGMYTVVLDGGSNTSAPFFPDAPTANSLNDLVGGMSPDGNWALKVHDAYSGYVAVLNAWGIKYIEGPSGFITGTVTNSETGAAIDSALVSSGGMTYTDAAGLYSLEVLAGDRSVSVTKTGYNSAFFTVPVATGETTVQDVALMALGLQTSYSSGFEAGDDLGSDTVYTGTQHFAVTDSFYAVTIYDHGAGTDYIDTMWVEPTVGSGMLVFPDSGQYNNSAHVAWLADSSYDISLANNLTISLDAIYDIEENYEYFHIGLMLDDSLVHFIPGEYGTDLTSSGVLTGTQNTWTSLNIDVSWALGLGSASATPAIVFSADPIWIEGWGGAFDNIALTSNPFYLASPGDIMATSYGFSIPVSWEAPASDGRVVYNVQHFDPNNVEDLHRPMIMGPNGELVESMRGPFEYEMVTVDYEYSNSSMRSLVGYNVYRSAWPFGEDELTGSSPANFYVDFSVSNGDYFDYWVEAVYHEGTSPPSPNKASARAGTPYVMVVDDFGVADFDSIIGEHWEQFSSSSGTATWIAGDVSDAQNAFYPNTSNNYVDSLNNSADTNFALVSDGRSGEAILISPFLDFTHQESAVLELDAFALMTLSTFSDYGGAKVKVRADMGEWVTVLDLGYNHNDGWEHEMVDLSWVTGWDKVQVAFGYRFGDYTSTYGNGLAIDNVDIHNVPGLTNLTATGTAESVELSWSAGGRTVRDNSNSTVFTEEEKMLAYEMYLAGQNNHVGQYIRTSSRQGGDTFADAVVIDVLPYYNTGTTVDYAADYGPYDTTGISGDLLCGWNGYHSGISTGAGPDVVYALTIEEDTTTVNVSLCGSGYDTALGVFDAADSTLVLGNDDGCGVGSYSSEVQCALPPGTYYIVISGWGSSAAGAYTIDVHEVEPMPDLLYNVFKDGDLIAEDLADTVLTYTDNDVGLFESCYTVKMSILELWSDATPDTGHHFAYVESDFSNEACAAMLNTPPGTFPLVTPADGAELVITHDNIDGVQVFAWSPSVDPNGSVITYHITWQTELDTGALVIDDDTTGTAVGVPYAAMAQIMAGYASYTGNYTADWYWTVSASDGTDEVEASNGPRMITVDAGWYLGINGEAAIPDVFALHQNYPNPFNPVTTIRYDVPEQAHVLMEIYNLLGQKVAVVVNGVHEPGFHAVRWNGTNMYGNALSSGMYFYHVQAGDFRSIKKLILVK